MGVPNKASEAPVFSDFWHEKNSRIFRDFFTPTNPGVILALRFLFFFLHFPKFFLWGIDYVLDHHPKTKKIIKISIVKKASLHVSKKSSPNYAEIYFSDSPWMAHYCRLTKKKKIFFFYLRCFTYRVAHFFFHHEKIFLMKNKNSVTHSCIMHLPTQWGAHSTSSLYELEIADFAISKAPTTPRSFHRTIKFL